jgi:hypothetical protein
MGVYPNKKAVRIFLFFKRPERLSGQLRYMFPGILVTKAILSRILNYETTMRF